MDILTRLSGHAWVAVGDEANWERGLENGIWGIVSKLERHWNKLDRHDLVLFYCKAPVSKVFGAGVIRSKFRQTTPLWKEEIEEGKCIWPFRFEFDVLYLLPLGQWRIQGVDAKGFGLPILAGVSSVAFEKAMKVFEALGGTFEEELLPEEQVRVILHEIGRMQRMIVETHYPVDGFSIDVIWKRIVRSVPTFAFALDLKGDFQTSLHTLKHAYDLWNSRPFLITDHGRTDAASELVGGLYHEFAPHLKVLSIPQIQELHKSKKTYYDLEQEYGLR